MAVERIDAAPSRTSFFNDPKIRSLIYQVLLVAVVAWLTYGAVNNALMNLRAQNIASGFGFLNSTAGFSISQTLIPYSEISTYGRAFFVGLLNTLLVAAIGIVIATILGFIIGVARLSKNWVIRNLATVYVEVTRNIPVLLQIVFWYFAVIGSLPSPRDSIELPFGTFLNVRGLTIPRPIFDHGYEVVTLAFFAGLTLAIGLHVWAKRRQARTGQPFPSIMAGLALVLLVPFLAMAARGFPISIEFPEATRFNLRGGIPVMPEMVALILALSIYTAGFIAEIVRAGILSVSGGQTEAAYALGLKPNYTLRLVVVPQALRVIIPPLTSQYLNLTKNSSLAVVIGYPDLFQVFAGTVLNQTGQAIEVIVITMGVYLTISLLTSALMNWYNRRVALVER